MIELIIPSVIAVISGMGVMTNRIYGRIMELDKRIDTVELSMAQAYVSKSDFKIVLDRVEAHMIRIEDKLDTIVANGKCVQSPPPPNY
jgi:hypothetical protein